MSKQFDDFIVEFQQRARERAEHYDRILREQEQRAMEAAAKVEQARKEQEAAQQKTVLGMKKPLLGRNRTRRRPLSGVMRSGW